MSPMSNVIDDLAAKFLEARGESGESEQRVIDRLTKRLHISRNARREFEENLTFGQRLADRIARFGGSWTFILIFLSLLMAWIVLNTIVLTRVARPFDAYPYIFLNLILSMLAALQAPIIMMSQNRQALKDRAVAANDYEVNLRAEMEVALIHERLDELVDRDWQALVTLQEEQLELLKRIDTLTSEIHQRWAKEMR
jgi:uncharacterized membrane protein